MVQSQVGQQGLCQSIALPLLPFNDTTETPTRAVGYRFGLSVAAADADALGSSCRLSHLPDLSDL